MFRFGLAIPMLAVLLLAAPVAAADATGTRYAAPIDGHGITGRVVVRVDANGKTGILKWKLDGLPPGRQVVIDVNGGTCSAVGGNVVWHKTPLLSGTSDSGKVALPDGSAGYFLNDYANRGGVTATVTGGHRSTCEAFRAMT